MKPRYHVLQSDSVLEFIVLFGHQEKYGDFSPLCFTPVLPVITASPED